MTKFYSFLCMLFTAATLSAQLVVTPVSDGVIKLTYGQSNDYSLYSPGFGTPSFWIHMWVPTSSYEDAWTDSNVEMVWNSAISAYEPTVNLNTKVWTNGGSVLPTNYAVDQLGLVFKNQQNGATSQSNDIIIGGTTDAYGFTGTTTLGALGIAELTRIKAKSFVSEGRLYTPKSGNLTVTVYDFSGKVLRNFNVKSNGNPVDLNMDQKGTYIVRVSNGTETEAVKFIK